MSGLEADKRFVWLQHIAEQLYQLQQTGRFCDASLEGEEEAQVKFHSLLLAASCPLFVDITPPFVLRCGGCHKLALEMIVRFLYTGNIDESLCNLAVLKEISHAADSLNINFLSGQIQQILINRESQVGLIGDGDESAKEGNGAKMEQETCGEMSDSQKENTFGSLEGVKNREDTSDTAEDKDDISQEKIDAEIKGSDLSNLDAENADDLPSTSNDNDKGENGDSASFESDECKVTAHASGYSKQVDEEPNFAELDQGFSTEIAGKEDKDIEKGEKPDHDDEAKVDDSQSMDTDVVKSPSKISKSMLKYLMKVNVKPSFIEPREIETEDNEILQYTCTYCKLCFEPSEQEEFIDHKKSHVEMKPYQCPVCLKRFRLKSAMQAHRLSHVVSAGKLVRKSNQESDSEMVDDRRNCNEPRYTSGSACDITDNFTLLDNTDKITNDEDRIKRKYKKRQRDKKDDSQDLSHHIEKTELIRHGHFKCSICNTEKKGFENFLAHKLKHAGVMPFHCKICNKGWYRKSDCKRHEQKANCGKNIIGNVEFYTSLPSGQRSAVFIKSSEIIRKDNRKFYKCSICDKEIVHHEAFLSHKFNHAGIRPYSCKLCRFSFTRLSDIKRHVQQSACLDIYEDLRKLDSESDSERDEKLDNTVTDQSFTSNNHKLAHPSPDQSHVDMPDISALLKQVEDFENQIKSEDHFKEKPTSITMNEEGMKTGIKSIEVENESSKHAFLDERRVIDKQIPTSQNICPGMDDSARQKLQLALHILETASKEELMENLKNSKQGSHESVDAVETQETVENKKSVRTSNLLSRYILAEEKIEIDEKLIFKCSICSKIYKNAQAFAGHKMHHSKERPFKCSRCPRGFTRKYDLMQHMQRHKLGLLHPCVSCGLEFTSKSRLVTHYISSSNECRMPSDLKWKDDIEGEKNSAIYKHQCQSCTNAYKTRQELALHTMRVHDGRGMKLYPCEKCSTVLTTKLGFIMHMKRHGNVKEFVCVECGKEFLRNCDLQAHLVKHGTTSAITCPTCGKSFKYRNSFRMHMMQHTGSKPYLCKMCGKAFTQKGNLRKHESETHAESQNYSCKLCSKKFYTEGGMRHHVKSSHSSERPFVCSICLKGFIQKQNLNRHMITHSDHRPFRCPMCPKSFRVIAHARRHCINVHGMTKQEAQDASGTVSDIVLETTQSSETTLANSAVSELLQGSSMVNIGGETFQVDLPPNSSMPTLQILQTPLHSLPGDSFIIKEDGKDDEQVLMLLENGDFAMQLQQSQFVMDDGVLSTFQQAETQEVASAPASHSMEQTVPVESGVPTEDQIMYYVKYE